MVQMDFDLAEPCPAQFRKSVEIGWLVLFYGKEKRVPRRSAIGIAKTAELPGILLCPGDDTLQSGGVVGVIRLRFIVVGKTQQQVNFFRGKVGAHMTPPLA